MKKRYSNNTSSSRNKFKEYAGVSSNYYSNNNHQPTTTSQQDKSKQLYNSTNVNFFANQHSRKVSYLYIKQNAAYSNSTGRKPIFQSFCEDSINLNTNFKRAGSFLYRNKQLQNNGSVAGIYYINFKKVPIMQY